MAIISNVPKLAQQDVFNSFLVRNATYAGKEEIPCVKTSKQLPEKVISFSKSISEQECDSWIHFYENDSGFERLWKNPKKYLPIIKRYKGIISPDYSLYYDIGNGKERIDFGKTIGIYIDKETGKRYPTTIGIIHSSKDGCHIVPARPKNYKGD